MFTFLGQDDSCRGLFSGLLQAVTPGSTGGWVGISTVTGKHYAFALESPNGATPGAHAILVGWDIWPGQPDHLTPNASSHSAWLAPEATWPVEVAEACSGLAFMGQGFQEAGFQPGPLIEVSGPVCDLLRTHRTKVLHQDVAHESLAVELTKAAGGKRLGLLAGFSCQPWSTFGDGKALADTRAASFAGVIRLALYMKPVFLLLENVWPCFQDPEVTKVLQLVAAKHGWTRHLFRMDLAKEWACQRVRGWMLMKPRHFVESVTLPPPLPHSILPGHLMPVRPRWPEEQEQELRLTAHELTQLGDEANQHRHLLHKDRSPGTMLHSLGNLWSACPCGCRPQPLWLPASRNEASALC